MKKKFNFLVYYIEDLKNFNNYELIDNFIPLTPNAESFLIDKSYKFKKNIFFSDYNFNYKVNKNIKIAYKGINKYLYELGISNHSLECAMNISYKLLSSYFYIKNIINDKGPWIIFYKNNWEKIYHKDEVIFKIYERTHINLLDFFKIDKLNIFDKKFVKLYNKVALNISKKNKIILSEKNLGFPKIINQLQKKKKNTSLIFFKRLKNNIFLNILSNFFKLIIDRNNITLFTYIDYFNKNIINFKYKNIENISLKNINIDDNSIKIISQHIKNSILFSNQFSSYLDIIFNKEFKLFIAHEIRWYENLSIAYVCKKNNIKVHLISHGSHALTSKPEDVFSVDIRANGMIYSKYADLLVAQSPLAYEYLINRFKQIEIFKSKPIMWGVSNEQNAIIKKNENNFVIVHASTSKILGGREWMYENSFEYIENIKFLIKEISKFNKVKLIIRFRENIENNYIYTKLLFKNYPNIKIKTSGNFYEDIINSDLIISYSSTIIEEGLCLRKPIALFGNDFYRHVKSSIIPPNKDDRFPVYSLNRNNFTQMLTEIINFHKKENLKDYELSNYTWIKEQNNFNYLNELI